MCLNRKAGGLKCYRQLPKCIRIEVNFVYGHVTHTSVAVTNMAKQLGETGEAVRQILDRVNDVESGTNWESPEDQPPKLVNVPVLRVWNFHRTREAALDYRTTSP